MSEELQAYVEEYGEELVYAALNLIGMDEDMIAHFTIEINDVELLVSVRKHTDGYYDKLASSLHKSS